MRPGQARHRRSVQLLPRRSGFQAVRQVENGVERNQPLRLEHPGHVLEHLRMSFGERAVAGWPLVPASRSMM